MRHSKICYGACRYKSHLRTAEAYCQIIQTKYQLTPNVNDADILILHREPIDFHGLYERHPQLARKYVIAYCVWEATDLPEPYKRSVQHIQEIWSCSRYSCEVFAKYHPTVIHIPHVIERKIDCSDADRTFVKNLISHEQSNVYYLSVAKASDPRKNVDMLARVFQRCAVSMPAARLIIKGSADDPLPSLNHPQIIYVRADLLRSQINALYELADIYVSVHHSEAWGLTLSDAMIFQKPVIASNYSGNLEFMNPLNSFLVETAERNIEANDCSGLFQPTMRWGYPSQEDLSAKLRLVYANLRESVVTERTDVAKESIREFNRGAVSERILKRLEALT